MACAGGSSPIVEDCIFLNNTSINYGGGLRFSANSNAIVRRCLFQGNSSYYGGNIASSAAAPQILNCTLIGGVANYGGGICLNSNTAAVIRNTIILGSATGYGILAGSSPNISIQYCDVYDNLPANFTGSFPAGMGVKTGVNVNGDSCDVYHNIFLYPEFVNPSYGDFHLLASSPCIDAGDPASPQDPDSTITDIGAFYYHQTAPVLNVTMTPVNPPIVIPANGGQFQFIAGVQRTQGPQAAFYAWARDRYPDGTYTGNLLGPVQINSLVGVTVTRQRTQVVPSSWPAGVHYYIGYAHTAVGYPATDADSFAWTKSTARDGGATIWEAANYGEEFPYRVSGSSTPQSFALTGASPNPFNPTTMISYELPAAGFISLHLYDAAGRLVQTLANGWREAGRHDVTFDGSGLTSGVYFCRLQAGNQSFISKMVLLK